MFESPTYDDIVRKCVKDLQEDMDAIYNYPPNVIETARAILQAEMDVRYKQFCGRWPWEKDAQR